MGSTLVMLLMISLLVILHELGHYWVARRCGVRVERFGIGLPFGPTLWRKKIGATEYCIHLLLFGGYVAFPDDNEDSAVPKDSMERFENQPLKNRAAIALAGVTVNAITAWLLMWFVIMQFGLASVDILFAKTAGPASPAAMAGIQGGEVIQGINGKPLPFATQVEKRAAFIKNSIAQSPGKPMVFSLKLPSGQVVDKTITPSPEGRIGVELGGAPGRTPVSNPITAFTLGVSQLNTAIVKQVEALGQLFTGQVKLNEVSGMIGIVKIGSDMFDRYGMAHGLEMIAILSMMLAFMNLLPIPALDGGHLLFLGLEGLFRKPVPKIIQERAIMTGFVSLLLLMSFTLFNDIYKLANNQLNLPGSEKPSAKPPAK
jgi:membrane-associated protease RseP (regulator of RpoE activity)